MTTTTSQVHSEAVSGWSPIGPLVSGMGGGLAFTILTGLAERLVLSLPSTFRTGYGPRCLSAQGQSRDLQHLSPMLTRCGNSALRDMAHMGVSPIDTCVPHARVSPPRTRFLGHRVLLSRCSQHDPLIVDSAQESCQGRTIFLKRSSRVEHLVFPRQFLWSKASPCKPFVEGA
jgi:hypothetical protein